jgi:hypothetical protein
MAADSVNDYIQYCGSYFGDPTDPILSPSASGYGSSILALYLNEFCPGGPGIAFVRRMFDNSHAADIEFGTNITVTSTALGAQWRQVLGSFHSRSYFTGTRALSGMFLRDATRLPQWTYTTRPATTTRQSSAVAPYAMYAFHHPRSAADGDTLTIGALCTRTRAIDSLWAVSVLLKRSAASRYDSIVPMQIGALGTDSLVVAGWSALAEALVVVSNASYSLSGTATVTFNDSLPPTPQPVLPRVSLEVYPNPIHLRSLAPVVIQAEHIQAVRIYTLEGALVHATHANPDSTNRVVWMPAGGASGRQPLALGTYLVVIEQDVRHSTDPKVTRRKLIVVP